MPGVEDLVAWKVARELADEVLAASRGAAFRGEGDLARQLRKAAVSVSSNIAEGYGRAKRGEFAHYLSIARGSAMEVQTQLGIALASGRLGFHRYQVLRSLADRSVALITKLRATVVKQTDRE